MFAVFYYIPRLDIVQLSKPVSFLKNCFYLKGESLCDYWCIVVLMIREFIFQLYESLTLSKRTNCKFHRNILFKHPNELLPSLISYFSSKNNIWIVFAIYWCLKLLGKINNNFLRYKVSPLYLILIVYLFFLFAYCSVFAVIYLVPVASFSSYALFDKLFEYESEKMWR